MTPQAGAKQTVHDMAASSLEAPVSAAMPDPVLSPPQQLSEVALAQQAAVIASAADAAPLQQQQTQVQICHQHFLWLWLPCICVMLWACGTAGASRTFWDLLHCCKATPRVILGRSCTQQDRFTLTKVHLRWCLVLNSAIKPQLISSPR